MATGEVIFTGSISGGIGGTFPDGYNRVIANLFDANYLTTWTSQNASGDYAILDIGNNAVPTRIRWDAAAGQEDRSIGATFIASSTANFATQVSQTNLLEQVNTGTYNNF